MTIKVARENRNPRDSKIMVGDLLGIPHPDPTMSPRLSHRYEPGTLGLVTAIGQPATCPDYVIAVFPHLGETVGYEDEWEIISVSED